jgi:hypothetical protein
MIGAITMLAAGLVFVAIMRGPAWFANSAVVLIAVVSFAILALGVFWLFSAEPSWRYLGVISVIMGGGLTFVGIGTIREMIELREKGDE